MYSDTTNDSFSFQLQNIALLSFEKDEEYLDILSPFTRVYLIKEGKGSIHINDSTISLEAGHIYLIPSLTSCSYFFQEGLSHYYIHFRINHPSEVSPYVKFSVSNKIKASELDCFLFQRLMLINPNLQLPHHDPNVYQKKLWLNKKVNFHSASQYIETSGILSQLFSRFIELTPEKNTSTTGTKYNIYPILKHIQNNINREIRVEELSELACLSKDHFSRIFKSTTCLSPGDYVLQKRLERAKFLLLSTDLSQDEIIEKTGFNSKSYFCRIFKQYTGYSPNSYRKKRG
ncbi:MAG: AraC family transcriptional regulator [Prolixibacteraceae bacterium]